MTQTLFLWQTSDPNATVKHLTDTTERKPLIFSKTQLSCCSVRAYVDVCVNVTGAGEWLQECIGRFYGSV